MLLCYVTLVLCYPGALVLCQEGNFQNNWIDCSAHGIHFGCIVMLEKILVCAVKCYALI